MTTMNPFLVQSTLPYLAPHFDQIANHHYRPAFDEGMQQKRAEIAAIALNPQTPDFNNTILALEQSGELLTRVTSVFFAMTAAHTNDELQRLDEQFSAELAELANDIYLNGELSPKELKGLGATGLDYHMGCLLYTSDAADE